MLRDLSLITPALAMILTIGGAACSSSSSSSDANVRVGDIHTNDVWKNGTKLTGVVRIFEGATVEIEPGARIACSDSAMIQVGGAVHIAGGTTNHAVITCTTWTGFQVVTNGKLDLQGLDIENADIGVETTDSAGIVNLTDVQILTTVRPLRIAAGTTVNATNVKATTPTTLGPLDTSVTEVYGNLVAKHLSYEANTNEGIMVRTGGTLDMEDSTLTAKSGLDLVSSYGGKSVNVRYTTLTGAHCGPHMEGVDGFNFDHVTSENNIFGITIYNTAATGSFVVKDSNLSGASAWLDLQGDHGPLNFTNVFTTGNQNILHTDPPASLTIATARIPDAQPRN